MIVLSVTPADMEQATHVGHAKNDYSVRNAHRNYLTQSRELRAARGMLLAPWAS